MATPWQWWAHSDAGLAVRIALGVSFFTALALWEWRRKGKQARRWREYLFLLTAVLAAMAYGVLNDQITVSISWEYFYYGKGLDAVLGPQTPPAPSPLRWEAAKVGMKATWTAGLLIGAAMLMANSVKNKAWPMLPERRLYALLPWPALPTIALAAVGGLAGRLGWLSQIDDLRFLTTFDLWRPLRFMSVWGIHMGAYLGGAAGTVLAILRIIATRRKCYFAAAACMADIRAGAL
jgi:hypothetical protein